MSTEVRVFLHYGISKIEFMESRDFCNLENSLKFKQGIFKKYFLKNRGSCYTAIRYSHLIYFRPPPQIRFFPKKFYVLTLCFEGFQIILNSFVNNKRMKIKMWNYKCGKPLLDATVLRKMIICIYLENKIFRFICTGKIA